MYFWLFFKSCHCQKNDEPDGGGEGEKRVGWEIGTVIFFLPFIFFTGYFFFFLFQIFSPLSCFYFSDYYISALDCRPAR